LNGDTTVNGSVDKKVASCLSDSKDYTDVSIQNAIRQTAIVCDAKPTISGTTITYVQDGVTKVITSDNKTKFYYTGSIVDSVLTGNLYCVGGFDPSLTQDDVSVIAESIRQAGVNKIRGTIIADKQMKEVLDYGEGWCWDDDNPMLIPLSVGRKDIFLTTLRKELERQGVDVSEARLGGNGVMPNGARHLSTYHHSIDVILNQMMKDSE
jgi:D-alanyl-D-alanine carboxypeptidase